MGDRLAGKREAPPSSRATSRVSACSRTPPGPPERCGRSASSRNPDPPAPIPLSLGGTREGGEPMNWECIDGHTWQASFDSVSSKKLGAPNAQRRSTARRKSAGGATGESFCVESAAAERSAATARHGVLLSTHGNVERYVSGRRAVGANDQAALRGLIGQRGRQVVRAERHFGEEKRPLRDRRDERFALRVLEFDLHPGKECAAGPCERRPQVEVGGRCPKRIGHLTPDAA